jgi:hypothetical protein
MSCVQIFTIPLERILHNTHFQGCNAYKYGESRNITRIHKQNKILLHAIHVTGVYEYSVSRYSNFSLPYQFYNMEELKIQLFSFRIWYHFTLIKCFSVEEDAAAKLLALI